MIVRWFDRKEVKDNYCRWIDGDGSFMLLHAPDGREIQDICDWLEVSSGRSPLLYQSDSRMLKHLLLEDVVKNLGGFDLFSTFQRGFSWKPSQNEMKKRFVQSVADRAKAGGDMTISVWQDIHATTLEPDILREHNYRQLTEFFLKDLSKLSCSEPLLLFLFLKRGEIPRITIVGDLKISHQNLGDGLWIFVAKLLIAVA